MTIADNGGFDVLLDLAPALVASAARERLALPEFASAFSTPFASGTGHVHLTVGNAVLEPGERLALVLSLDGSSMDFSPPEEFPRLDESVLHAPLAGSVAVRDRLDADGLDAAVDLSADAAAGTPLVEVALDTEQLLQAPLPMLLVAAAFLRGGEAEALRTRTALVDAANRLLVEAATALEGRPLRTTLFSFPASLDPAGGVPPTQTPIALSTPTGSLRIGARLGARSGDPARISRGHLADGDALALVVSNACLLRDVLRPRLSARLGLAASGFVPDDPFLWGGSAPLPVSGATASIRSLGVFVNEAQRVVLLLSVSASAGAGAVSAVATIALPVAIGARVEADSLTLTFTPETPTVSGTRVDVAWWVYAAATVLGPEVLAALAVADAIADGSIARPIADAIRLPAMTTSIPLPAGLTGLRVTDVSLFQADAPRRTVRAGSFSFLAPGRDHDVILRMA